MAAQSLPPGTALPVEIGSSLNARNAKPGQKIEGKLMQELQLPSGDAIKKGAHVVGQVVSVQRPSRVTVKFTQLEDGHQTIPLSVSLRAVAASESVFNAGVPIDANSTYDPSNEYTTRQIGGDVVFRGRGYVASDQGKVGRWNGTGVWGMLAPGGDCPASEDNRMEQALWIFSTTACGVYGIEGASIAHAGRTPPVGQITLQSDKDLLVRGGSGWLLLVNSNGASAAGASQ